MAVAILTTGRLTRWLLRRRWRRRTAAPQRPPWRPLAAGAVVTVWVTLGVALHGRDTLALPAWDTTPRHDRLTAFRDWIDGQRHSGTVLAYAVDAVREGIAVVTTLLRDLISQPSSGRPVPAVGWLGVLALVCLVSYALAGGRMALLAASGFAALGLLGWWSEAMDTLALTVAAVVLSVGAGIPLGVCMGLSRRATRLLTPVLDMMQALPTFVYLLPLTLFFLIGPPVAVITTFIYAIAPVMRLTALGIRQVNVATVEASRSLGATRWQVLRTVQLPLARPTIVVGINQTTMAALSMVMITALIDGPGLGTVVLRSLSALDVGRAFTSGLAIVILAVVLDRVTTAASNRSPAVGPAPARSRAVEGRRWLLAGGAGLAAAAVWLSHSYYWASRFPGPLTGGLLGGPVAGAAAAGTDWVEAHLFGLTNAVSDAITYGLINPLQSLIAGSPWYVVASVVLAMSLILRGVRAMVLAGAGLGALLASDLWEPAMVTLASVLVATLLVLALGITLGVLLGHSRRADLVLRPVLDAAQAMPAFVYLIPFVGLFGVGRLTAILAAVVFAAPVVTKIVTDAVRAVPRTVREAATATGSSRWQLISKVELPLARPALALAANQGLIYVLSVVVIGALVGAGGLGYLVVAGFSQSHLFGKGLAAGLAIVVLGILLDRLPRCRPRSGRS